MGNSSSLPAGEAEVADGQGRGASGHAATPTRSDAGCKRGSRAREQAPSNPMSPLFSAHTQPTNHGRVVLDLRGVPTDPDSSSYAIWVEKVPQQRRSYAAEQDPGMGLMSLLSSVGGTLITLLTAQKLWEEVQTLRTMRSQAGRNSSNSSRGGGGASSSGGAGGPSDISSSPSPGPVSKPRDSSSRTPALELPTNVPKCTRVPLPSTDAAAAAGQHTSASARSHSSSSPPDAASNLASSSSGSGAVPAAAVASSAVAVPNHGSSSSSSSSCAVSCGPGATPSSALLPTPSSSTTGTASSSGTTAPGYGSGAWSAIAGLEDVKVLLQEATVLPLLRPDLFRGARQPPRGVLLFGPPGTGKTLLARAVAAESGAAFVAITGSNILSKWYGESEANVRQLFKRLARKAPAVLFIDEVDSLLAKRAGEGSAGGSGTSRRVANEFLAFIDGIQTTTHHSASSGSDGSGASQDGSSGTTNSSTSSSSGSSSGIVVMAATNAPWELDEAALSRFAARVLVPLPGVEARQAILQKAMEGVAEGLSGAQWRQVAERAAGYSGRDLVQVCREAAMRPVRELFGNRVLTGSHAEQIWAQQRARLVASLVRALDAGSSSKDLRKQLAAWHTRQQVGWCSPEELLHEAQEVLKQQRAAAAEKRKQEAAAAKQQRAAEQQARRLLQQQQQQQQQQQGCVGGVMPPSPVRLPCGAAPPPPVSCSQPHLPLGPPAPSQPSGSSPPAPHSPRAHHSSTVVAASRGSNSSSRASPGPGPVTVALSVQQESGRVSLHLGLPSAAADTHASRPTSSSSSSGGGGATCTNRIHSSAPASGAGADCDSSRSSDSSSSGGGGGDGVNRVTVKLAVSEAGRVSVRCVMPPAVANAVSGDSCISGGQCPAASAAGTVPTTSTTPDSSSSSAAQGQTGSVEEPAAAAAAAAASGGHSGALQLASHDLHLDQEEVDWSDSEPGVDQVDQPAAAGPGQVGGTTNTPSCGSAGGGGSSSSGGGGDAGDKVRTLRDLLTLPQEAIRPVQYEDFDWALQHVASTDFDATNRYQEWAQQYGAGGASLNTQPGWKFMPMYL